MKRITSSARVVIMLAVAPMSGCSDGAIVPSTLAKRVVIATGVLDFVEIPLGGRTQVTVQARAADGTIVRDAPTPVLISRDTTRFVVEPGLWVRSVGTGGSTQLVARLVVDGLTLSDSVRVSTVVPLK